MRFIGSSVPGSRKYNGRAATGDRKAVSSASRMSSSRLAPLHRRLLLLVAAALLPVAILSVVGLVLLARQARSEVERGTVETMRAMVSAVDTELQRSVSAVETL